jgi:hypothetical protein
VAIFWEDQFPAVDGFDLSQKQIQSALGKYDYSFLKEDELWSKLNVKQFDLLLTVHGSAFPKEAEGAILNFLRAGGSWVNLGGTPLAVPVVRVNEAWHAEPRQVQFHKKLGLTQAFGVSTASVKSFTANPLIDGAESFRKEFTLHSTNADEVFECYYRFTNTKDFPNEDGSSGQRDARLDPLVWGIDTAGDKLVAPIIQIDRLQGEFAGGRWMLANFSGTISETTIGLMVDRSLQGVQSFSVSPTLACYHDGEVPAFNLRLQANLNRNTLVGQTHLTIFDATGGVVEKLSVSFRGAEMLATATVVSSKRVWKPGYYHVESSQQVKHTSGSLSSNLNTETGFWIYDSKLIASGTPLTVDANYFYRNGEVYPITGTTYMASDVARKFLFEPNVSIWHEDFAAMKQAGINMVRTGIWNSHKNYMLDVGSPNEQFLRSLDAFILTARTFDIPIIFTFFAFLPETWGGENAYLDPRSVNAQKQFLATVAQRYSAVNDITWDLINEPSFCNPGSLWSCRPNNDQFEVRAWNDWLKNRYDRDSTHSWQNTVRLNFRMTTEEPIALPTAEDFLDLNIFDHRRPQKAHDYRLFAQDMFKRWVGEMTSALRTNGNARQMITVGQDEGGTNDSPNNQFMGDALEFTSMHNWWLNDDLVWDNVITKAPGKPNLLQETGVMFYERPDGSAWRSEQEAAELLERKLAISLGAGGAGFIEWIWDINPYMKSDNEATIGLHRVDGTVKPELDVVRKYAKFFQQNAKLMKRRAAAEVLLVIPHANMFSTRNSATEATKKSIRTLAYCFGIIPQAVSEFRLELVPDAPKLVILPSPQILSQDAWERLLKFVEAGSTLLISGPIEHDEHWLPVARVALLGITATVQAVVQNELPVIGDKTYPTRFRQLKIQRLFKLVDTNGRSIITIPWGKGNVFWSTLPLENAEEIDPLVAFYELGVGAAEISSGFPKPFRDETTLYLTSEFANHVMLVGVSETSWPTRTDISNILHGSKTSRSFTIEVPPQRTGILFIDRRSGEIVSHLR